MRPGSLSIIGLLALAIKEQRMLKQRLCLISICIYSSFAIAQEEMDANLLMLATDTSFMMAIAPKCEKYLPGYQENFDTAFAAADKFFFKPHGINDQTRLEATKYRELNVNELVQRFEQGSTNKKIATCENKLSSLLHSAGHEE